MSQTGQSGQPGRYSRSFGGLVGAMLVLVAGLVVLVGLRAFTSDPQPYEAGAVDYREVVGQVQEAGGELVYPASLPEGWEATNVDFRPGPVPVFELSLLTEDGAYVGLREEDAPLRDLLSTYVDESTTDAPGLDLPDGIAPRWTGHQDSGGDTAYAATIGQRQVLVFGSASPDQLAALVGLLTEEPVAGSTTPSGDASS